MATLTNEQIAAAGLERSIVHVPEWSGDVIIQAMSLADRMRIEDIGLIGEKTNKYHGMKSEVLARSLINEDGTRRYKNANDPALLALDGKITDRLFGLSTDLSGITSDGDPKEDAVAGES